MRIAIPVWSGRVSNVFDFAHRLLLVNIQEGQETDRREIAIEQDLPVSRAALLSRHSVDLLICGAISRALAELVATAGIKVMPSVTGPVEDVLAAYLNGRPLDPRFLLPGSAARRSWGAGRRFRGGRG